MATISSIKGFNATLKSIATKSGSLRQQAVDAANFVIEHGKTTNHYDLAVNLVNTLSFNTTLQKDILGMFIGVIPHSLPNTNGTYRLGKRDKSLLITNDDYEAIQTAKLEKKAETRVKIAKSNAEKKAKLDTFDQLKIERDNLAELVNVDQISTIKDLQTSKAAVINELETLESKVNRLTLENDRLTKENLTYQKIAETFNGLKKEHSKTVKLLTVKDSEISALKAAMVTTQAA